MELVKNKPYNYALVTLFLSYCELIDGIMLTLRNINIYYNTAYHSTLHTSSFTLVYGRAPPELLSYVPGHA